MSDLESQGPTYVISTAKNITTKQLSRQVVTSMTEFFSHHAEVDDKDYAIFLPGELVGKERKKEAVASICWYVADIDGGQSFDDVVKIVRERKLLATMYTSYSHLTTKSTINMDRFTKWAAMADLEDAIQPPHMCPGVVERYLAETGQAGKYGATFKVQDRLVQTAKGMAIVVTHEPLEKFRLVLPLKVPFVFVDHGMTSSAQIAVWKSVYHGVGDALGLKFDHACSDASRPFYRPSCPIGGSKIARLEHFEGDALDFTLFPRAVMEETAAQKKAKTKPTAAKPTAPKPTTGKAKKDAAPIAWAPWLAKNRGSFQLATVLHEKGYADAERTGDGGGYFLNECPFEEEHSAPSPQRTYVCDPHDDAPFTLWCSGNACQSHRLRDNNQMDQVPFLDRMIELGWLTPDDLGGLQTFSSDDVKRMLGWAPAAIAGLMVVYSFQSEEEKAGDATVERNGKGFDNRDAEKLTTLAKRWQVGEKFSAGELRGLTKSMPKYWKQVLPVISRIQADAEEIKLILESRTKETDNDLPEFFDRGENGITFDDGTKESGYRVCQDFETLASTLDHKAHHGVGISYKGRLGHEKEAFFKYSEIHGKNDAYIARLVDDGFDLEPTRHNAFKRLLNGLKPPTTITRTNKPGWTANEEFVLPGVNGVKLVGNNEVLGQKGTLEGWQNAVAKYAKGNSRLTLALCQMFVGPLLHLFPGKAESGGFYLYGPSGDGKSAVVIFGASVWGPNFVSLHQKITGVETSCTHANDVGFCGDELVQFKDKLSDLAYMLGNGHGRHRGKGDGEKIEPKTFRLAVLLCGEKTFEDYIEERGEKVQGGHAARLINIRGNAGAGYGVYEELHGFQKTGNSASDGAAFSDYIKAQVALNHGTAGPAFVKWLVEHLNDVKSWDDMLTEMADSFTPSGAGNIVRRVAMRFALTALAGEFAIEAGVLPLDSGEPTRVMFALFGEYLKQRGGIEAAEVLQGTRRVFDFIRQYPMAFQTVAADAALPYGINGRVGFVVGAQVGRAHAHADGERIRDVFYFIPESFKRICGNAAFDGVAEYLRETGCLVVGENGRLQRKKVFEGMSVSQRYYAVMLPVERDPVAELAQFNDTLWDSIDFERELTIAEA